MGANTKYKDSVFSLLFSDPNLLWELYCALEGEDIVRKCKTLAGYSAFVAKVREFEQASGDKSEAMKQAVRYCRDHDILKEFLDTRKLRPNR